MNMLKPYYDTVIELEGGQKLKEAQLTTMALALEGLMGKY